MSRGDAVLAVGGYTSNADLIAACFQLGYLAEDRRTLDPTYGLGRFWKTRRPVELVASDLDITRSPVGASIDFTALPWPDADFDDVVFDPPYKLNGTSRGTGPAASDDSYGVAGQATSWQDRHALIRAGIDECARVLRPGGHLLIKCQDQVCSGRVRWQTREFADHAEGLGCVLVDALILVGHRQQPPGRRQVHARRNYSTLLVLQKGKTP